MTMHPILVRNISHLTDARYFAAMGVDWMSIRLDSNPVSFSFWHTLRDWVEGVRLAAEIDEDDEMLLSKIIIDAKPDGIIAGHLEFVHLTGGLDMFVTNHEFNASLSENGIKVILPYIHEQTEPHSFLHIPADLIFLESHWTAEAIVAVKTLGFAGGFCFHSSPETKTGMKDYSDFDHLLELIQE